MAFLEKRKRKWGDRVDGHWVKDAPGMNVIMTRLYPNRADSEVYLNQKIDVTNLLKFLETKNTPDAPYKTTIFHCMVAIIGRVLNERPILNRFVMAGRIYERDEIIVNFTAKRKFEDHAEEALMTYKARPDDTLESISRFIVGDVKKMRAETSASGLDDILNKFAKLPRPLLLFIVKAVRWLDFWGKAPRVFCEGNPNYSSVLVSNLGSIKCPAVYHHLNNYGTNSILITIGVIHKAPVVMPDNTVEIRDVMEIGATLDERIGDGFYFAKSLKLIQHICNHPELLDKPLKEESGYDYK